MVWFRNEVWLFFSPVFLWLTACRNSKINNSNHILSRTTITWMTKVIAIEKVFIFLWLVFFSALAKLIGFFFSVYLCFVDLEVELSWRTFHFNFIVWNRMERKWWFFGNIPKRLYCYSVALKLDYEIESHSSAFSCFFCLSTHTYTPSLTLFNGKTDISWPLRVFKHFTTLLCNSTVVSYVNPDSERERRKKNHHSKEEKQKPKYDKLDLIGSHWIN